jgi:hypothetical protein
LLQTTVHCKSDVKARGRYYYDASSGPGELFTADVPQEAHTVELARVSVITTKEPLNPAIKRADRCKVRSN